MGVVIVLILLLLLLMLLLFIRNLALELDPNQVRPGEVPWMVSHHPQDGHPPFQGWSPTIQNLPEGSVLHYRLRLWHLDLTHKIKTR